MVKGSSLAGVWGYRYGGFRAKGLMALTERPDQLLISFLRYAVIINILNPKTLNPKLILPYTPKTLLQVPRPPICFWFIKIWEGIM